MSKISSFAHKSIVAFMLLMMTSGTFTPSARVNAERERINFTDSRPDQGTANIVPLGAKLIQDPGFEGSFGSTTGPWFQSPPDTICIDWDGACSVNGAGYNSWPAWAGFGPQESSFGDVYQNVAFPRCGAQLQFVLYIGEYFGPGSGWGLNNHFQAMIDGTVIFEAFGSEAASYQTYKLISKDVSQFADGAVHKVEFSGVLDQNFLFFNLDDVNLIATNTKNCAEVTVKFGGATQGTYGIPQNQGDRQSFPVSSGPVFVNSTNNIVTAERVAYLNGNTATSFSEMMGLPQNLVSNKYSFPAYDNANFNSQFRFGNVSGSTVTVRINIGPNEMTSGCFPDQPLSYPYNLQPGASLRVSCPGVNGGPVVIESTGGNIIAAVRVVPLTYNGSYSEVMGVPQGQVNTTYYFPWYNNLGQNSPSGLGTQLRIANVSGSANTVHIYVHGQEVNSGCSPKNSPFTLLKNESIRITCTTINNGLPNNGPVKIVGSGNLVASERVAYFDSNNAGIRFSELMGLPAGQLTTTYLFPWYNDASLDTQLRFGNVSTTQQVTVHVYIAGQEMTSGCTVNNAASNSPYTLAGGGSLRVSCPGVSNGPVKIVSTGNIVASERVAINNGSAGVNFSEIMGLPQSQLTTSYVFPWYNNLGQNSPNGLDTQLRFGVP